MNVLIFAESGTPEKREFEPVVSKLVAVGGQPKTHKTSPCITPPVSWQEVVVVEEQNGFLVSRRSGGRTLPTTLLSGN